ncbi:RNA 2'-phosphotransferase [Flavobacterium sp. Fl-318]|uniref:Probable RNA 2'-phosphotransferase n=1 Tax=Flavobacterium cupriresistens TaxID=2893885 RepID=A0ABU4RG26_9FLAO|nr:MULTISPECIES: RNA 2'-phosphotransferase [unclassified Flavobacterium]MDX6191541.1 RNA 2'-phosphotransferase [Flavobacterium sp. Fl-318]UFH43305.1 RNA 2'-phosphotransferase [Flavobacterium sp. F-323]
MDEKIIKGTSKFLSFVLRHSPETIDLKLDENGWANVDELIPQSNKHKVPLDFDLLQVVVATNDKKRFIFNEDKTKIRASQGHSINVELNLTEVVPQGFLYHGTVAASIDSIKETGLQKMSRQHVHLSKDKETAIKVGGRRGKPVILTVDAERMQLEGFKFYLSENGVWLTDEVPARYIEF